MTNAAGDKAGKIAPAVVYFTYDEERVEHIISDDKLILVANGGRDISLEICIGAAGVALGYAQNIVTAISQVRNRTPVDAWQSIGAAIFLIAFATCFVTALQYKRTAKTVDSLISQIRSRKIGTMGEQPYEEGKPFAADPSKDTSSTTG